MRFDLLVLAEFWFRKATQMTTGKDDEPKILFQKCRVIRLYGPLTTDCPIKVDFTEYGRAIYATEDIPEGETVFEDSVKCSTLFITKPPSNRVTIVPSLCFHRKNISWKPFQPWKVIFVIWC